MENAGAHEWPRHQQQHWPEQEVRGKEEVGSDLDDHECDEMLVGMEVGLDRTQFEEVDLAQETCPHVEKSRGVSECVEGDGQGLGCQCR